MKLLFACPTYGAMDPAAVTSQRVAIMKAANRGVQWVGQACPDRMAFAAARNAVVEAALHSEADAVFWCDSDMVLPPHACYELARHQLDFVTGLYFQRQPPHWPLVGKYNEAEGTFQWAAKWPSDLAEIDGCGFGCCLTSVKLLRAVGPEPFQYGKISEDLTFCLKVRECGFKLYLDPLVVCGHLSEAAVVTMATFLSEHPELR